MVNRPAGTRTFRDPLGPPVVGIDMDGTLGDYHSHFLAFAEGWLGKKMPDPAEINPGLPLYKFMGISKERYRRCKLAYRRGGLKRSMPCYDYARELTVQIRKAGALVCICTSRPYLAMEAIEEDTMEWLRRNGIQYDDMVWGEHKYRDLVRRYGKNRIVAVLDDLPEMIQQAESLDLRAYVRTQPYNRHLDLNWYYRVDSLDEAILEIGTDIQDWFKSRKESADANR